MVTMPEELSDEALLAEVGRMMTTADPVPEAVYRLGYAAFALRSVDAELAELVDDSAARPADLATVRGEAAGTAVRMLSYQASEVGVELHVTPVGGGFTALGQVFGGAVSAVLVESPQHGRTVPIDDLGRFDITDLQPGLFRLHLLDPDRPTVITDWTML
jgi:hypothetical protein